MNILLLNPTDILFFRDGRPMGGASAGHGAAWPLPSVTDAAFHAALHRSGLTGHAHDQRCGAKRNGKDNRRFGSLVTAGPFPVQQRPDDGQAWFFPRPADADDSGRSILHPLEQSDPSSLPAPCRYPVVSSRPPSKTAPKPWWSAAAWQSYLNAQDHPKASDFIEDANFASTEHAYGIGIDSSTGSVTEGAFYSAHYLRLRDDWRLGVFAKTNEKNDSPDKREDLIPNLVNEQKRLLVGGQQRLCTAELLPTGSCLPLPRGKTDGFACHDDGGRKRWLVKWILLSPAVWPEIPDRKPDGTPITDKDGRYIQHHPGGWLPNWVRQSDGQVMLRSGKREARRYAGKHSRGFSEDSKAIAARLVAALVGKPIPVTGYALPHETTGTQGGAKPTHLAVPAGAVYYFEADNEDAARKLAAALNWHGADTAPSTIRNRRSTLMGEKGFGLGVCGTWNFHSNHQPG